MKKLKTVYLLVLTIAVGCAQAPRTPGLTQYQTKSAQILGSYAGAVSRGFGKGSTSKSTRGAYTYTDPNQTDLYQSWYQQNGNYIAKSDFSKEIADCQKQIASIPKNCNNLGFMTSSLARCLDRVIAHQNPVYAYAYRQLDRPGQQYYTYLLDWRRPQPVQYYNYNDYQLWNPYAYTGWVQGDVTY